MRMICGLIKLDDVEGSGSYLEGVGDMIESVPILQFPAYYTRGLVENQSVSNQGH